MRRAGLTLPAKFRDSFPEGLVLTRGMDGCVYAYAKADWSGASRLASPRSTPSAVTTA